jgi:hypothetical protein
VGDGNVWERVWGGAKGEREKREAKAFLEHELV